ncbi:MAG: CAP domain-containing protein [Bacillota bacterium]|nr:CAP domain-containing protein [Bacillota bacterium]
MSGEAPRKPEPRKPERGSSAGETLSMWMESQGHRVNILNPAFTHAGVGVSCGGSYGTTTIVIFVKRN